MYWTTDLPSLAKNNQAQCHQMPPCQCSRKTITLGIKIKKKKKNAVKTHSKTIKLQKYSFCTQYSYRKC